MFDSVRLRLTVWHTAILATILAIFATGVYLLISERLYEELDAGLRAALDVSASSLRHELEEHRGDRDGEAMFATVLRTLHHASFPRQSIQVFSGSRLVAAKEGAGGPVPLPAKAPFTARPHFETAATPSGDQRLALLLVTTFDGAVYRLMAAEPVDPTRAQLAGIRSILIIAVPFALALAAVFGYLLARKSLAPVVAMSNQVDRMTAGSLGERLAVVNPHDELGRLASTFNRLLERLQDAFEQQRRFMADASHELRTPIAVSRTAAEVTLDASTRPVAEYRESLSLIAGQMRRLTRVVNDMFTLARADSGAYVIHRRPFYLNDLLQEALKAAQLLANPKQIRIHADPLPEAPYSGDEDLIRQLVLILLDNAIKYTGDYGSVHLRLEPGYTIVVSDTGIGIPAEARPHIFDRFFRVDKSRSRSSSNQSGGTGLGLAIARWIAEVHYGTVELRSSEVGRGSVFAVVLPHNEPAPPPRQQGAGRISVTPV